MADLMHPRNADVVIVGGGSAGALLAARLSEVPARRVVLVEAGEEADDPDIWNPAAWPALQGRSYDWDYLTEPQAGTAGRVHHWARGRLMGGSSCLHAMGYMRGHPSDFQPWVEATGDSRWSWDELLPVFMANEDHPLGGDGIHGRGGPMPVYLPEDEVSPVARAFIEAGASLGLPRLQGHNSGNMIGVTPNSLNIRNGRRITTAEAWLTPAVRGRENLTVLTGTLARRLVLDANRVRGIEIVGREGSTEISAERIVLSSGALESPALLMRSGIGPRDVLKKAGVACLIDLPGVGRNLQDHLLGAGNLYAAKRPVPPSRLQHSESMAYMRAGDFTATGQPDIVVGCGIAPIVSERFKAPAAGTAYSLLFGITHPTSRGSLRIIGPEPHDRLLIDAFIAGRSSRHCGGGVGQDEHARASGGASDRARGDPRRILLMTFSRRAAADMTRRAPSASRPRRSAQRGDARGRARMGAGPSTGSARGSCANTRISSGSTRPSPSMIAAIPPI
jgi:pyridoxine 4-oxidase